MKAISKPNWVIKRLNGVILGLCFILISIGGVEPMLQAHLGICLHVGLTEPQLKQALSPIKTNVGKAEAERAVLA